MRRRPPDCVKVAFLGPAGTYAEEALRASAPGEVEEVPYPTVHETVLAVQEGAVDRGVVPIENSLEGGVAATLDALAGEADDVRIVAEVIHPVHHCAVAARELALEDAQRVFSHPQATAQCRRFLLERLPSAERVASPSTAEAVRVVAEADEPWVALGSRLSAELYGAVVLEENVEDRSDNETRFVWLARDGAVEAPEGGTRSKTSVVFWGAGDESPGWLVAVLSELSEREINLTRIESRPRRVRLGHYMFFADLEGPESDPHVSEALAALRERVETLRVLGSYPAA
jgi:prephenate dehydratase